MDLDYLNFAIIWTHSGPNEWGSTVPTHKMEDNSLLDDASILVKEMQV